MERGARVLLARHQIVHIKPLEHLPCEFGVFIFVLRDMVSQRGVQQKWRGVQSENYAAKAINYNLAFRLMYVLAPQKPKTIPISLSYLDIEICLLNISYQRYPLLPKPY